MERGEMWVFGYGSLIWKPGFQYQDSKPGFIRGYVRRFWQGNDSHRGIPGKPGRVATLIEDKEGITWGRAFQLRHEDAIPSLEYLNNRESKLGGYVTTIVQFQPRDLKDPPIPVMLYIALPSNRMYLGSAPLQDIADQIVHSEGPSGHNVEYLYRLADYMRETFPDVWDAHLYTLELLVKARLEENNISLQHLMGEKYLEDLDLTRHSLDDTNSDSAPSSPRPDVAIRNGFDFASHVPPRKLRCLDL
ncbi:putative glutathione-specific gamma-glutamylcyclotransferase 2 [Tachypleus tridentatus]